MNTHRVYVPSAGVPHIDRPGLAGEIHDHLECYGLPVKAVSIARQIDVSEGVEPFQVAGPFVLVETDRDPSEALAAFAWRPKATESVAPDVELRAFVQSVEDGSLVSHDQAEIQDAMIRAITAIARTVLDR